mgnify:CR=1 FL=1
MLNNKLGMFIHWGIYSVPAYGSEWYSRSMYDPDCREFFQPGSSWFCRPVFPTGDGRLINADTFGEPRLIVNVPHRLAQFSQSIMHM